MERRLANRTRKTDSERAATYQVKVLDKAIDILDAFTLHQRELGMREIVQATGLNRSTATRLVANLERRGLLQQAPDSAGYRLGQRLFELGSIVHSSFSVLEAAAAPLTALERRSGATIVVAIRNGDHSVTVDKRQGVGDGFAMVQLARTPEWQAKAKDVGAKGLRIIANIAYFQYMIKNFLRPE